MSTDLASLILKVDSTQVKTGADQLDRLTAAGQKAEGSVKRMTAEQYKAVQAIDSFAKATNKLPANMNNAVASTGRMRAGMQQLSFQIGDVSQQFALGVSPMRIFVQQGGQVIQALQVMGGQGNKLLSFIGGPWGIGIAAAGAVLVPLIAKLLDGSDAIGKMVKELEKEAKEARDAAAAQAIFDRGIEGSIVKVKDLTKALIEQNRTLEDTINLSKAATAGALGNVVTNIGTVSADLAKAAADFNSAKVELSRAESGIFAGSSTEANAQVAAAQDHLRTAEQNVRTLTGQLNALSNAANQGAHALGMVDFPLIETRAKEAIDPIARINRQYDEMAKKAKQAGTYTQELATKLERLRKAELDAASASSKGSGLFGKQVSFDEAAAIARSAGLNVTSAYRSTAKQAALFNDPSVNRPGNPVAAPGSSAHEGVRGKWALDIAFAPGLTPQKLKKLYGDQGVSLSTVLKENGHFHIEGSRSQAAAQESEAEREAAKALDRQQAFQKESERLDGQIQQAKGQMLQGIDSQADFAVQQLEIERQNYESGLNRLVADKKLEAVDAQALIAKNAGLTTEKEKAVEQQRQLAHMRQQSEASERQLQNQIDDLSFADEMARSNSEHRTLQLEILDVVYQQKEAHLRALKAELLLAGKIEEAAAVQGQIDRLPTEKGQDQARANRNTMNPLEQWAQSVPQTADQINEAFENIAAHGLDSLSQGITDVIMGTKSLGDMFSEISKQIIAEILQMIVKMMIFKAIQGAIGGGGGMLGSFGPFAKGGVFSGGHVIPFASGGVVGGPTMFPMSGGRAGLMGEAGPEAIMPLTRDPSGRLGVRAANDQQRIVVELNLNDDMLNGKIVQGANAVVEFKRKGIVDQAVGTTMRGAQRPKLMGR